MDFSLKGRMNFFPGRVLVVTITLTMFMTVIQTGTATTVGSWQPVEIRPWAHIDTPAGWNTIDEKNETISPDSALFTAVSPDKKSRIIYILEHNQDTMTIDTIRAFQSNFMSTLGFRICMTKDPVFGEKPDHTSFRQVYVRGTTDAAVIGTAVYPGWGQAHYILVMEGPEAVGELYESIPPVMEDHIRPIPAE
jgi:hypothetical protein